MGRYAPPTPLRVGLPAWACHEYSVLFPTGYGKVAG